MRLGAADQLLMQSVAISAEMSLMDERCNGNSTPATS